MERLREIMPKKQVALVLAGAVVVASAAYLYFRSRPKKQIPHGKAPIFQSPQVAAQAPVQKNVEELQLQIDAGDTSAMCKLALLHLKGDDASGLKQDVPRALELLHQAAENGGVEAMIHLGSCHESADIPGISHDPEETIKWWKRAMEAGSGVAAKLLGDLYLNMKVLRLADADSGFVPNQLVRLHGLSSAALNGALCVVSDPAALNLDSSSTVSPGAERLAVRLILAPQEMMEKHASGLKVKVANMTRLTNAKDFGKAADCYKKGIQLASVDNSGPECMVELAKLYEEGQGFEKSDEEAFKLYKMATDSGFQPAYPRLAMCYYTGAGVEQDYNRCFELVTLSSTHCESQLVLSFLYSEGHAVDKDENKALELLRESARTCAMAMHILGNMHLSGQQVEQDHEQAMRYLKQASDLDFVQSQALCGQMLLEGMGCDKSEENQHLGFKLLSVAADQAEPNALYYLCNICFTHGDHEKALEFLKRAVSAKHPEAMYRFGQMLKKGVGELGVPADDAEGERLMADAVKLGFDVEAAKAAAGQ